jgi:lipoate-protein ligase B
MTLHVVLDDLTPYVAAHALQEGLVAARAAGRVPDVLLTLEHPATITVGRRRDAERNVVGAGTVPVVRVERGGDVTYHAPGQLVSYPIIALSGDRRDLRAHLHSLEEAVIATIGDLGLEAFRDPRNTGVWVGTGDQPSKKICSIGVACRSWVTWHGLALNVDVDLAGFSRINPCGFGASIMTRLADHVPSSPPLQDLAVSLSHHLSQQLGVGDVRRVRLRPPMDALDAADMVEYLAGLVFED